MRCRPSSPRSTKCLEDSYWKARIRNRNGLGRDMRCSDSVDAEAADTTRARGEGGFPGRVRR